MSPAWFPSKSRHITLDTTIFHEFSSDPEWIDTQRIVTKADAVIQGTLPVWNHQFSWQGEPVWHRDPVTGHEWPIELLPWVEEAWRNRPPSGALRRLWELNRQPWLFDLAAAYRITGDERYRDIGWRHINSWLTRNPEHKGVNWTSPLEFAFRMAAWFSFSATVGVDKMPEDIASAIPGTIHAMATRTAWDLSVWPAPTNHLAGEAFLLVLAGAILSGAPERQGWIRKGRHLLMESLDSHIGPTGSPGEQAPSYLLFVLETYLTAQRILMALPNHEPFPQTTQLRIAAGLIFLHDLLDTWGSLPLIGDSDEAALLPWDADPVARYSGLAQAAEVLMDVPVPEPLKPSNSGTLLLGSLNNGTSQRRKNTRVFDEFQNRDGWIMGRSGESARIGILFLAKPLGLPPRYGHGHADALSILVSVNGTPLLTDTGTYSYEEQPWRNYFRGTAAHNTVTVEDRDQADPVDSFTWISPYKCKSAIDSRNEFVNITGSHTGYRRLPQQVDHTRCLTVHRDHCEISDKLQGERDFLATLRWHIDPRWTVRHEQENSVLFQNGDTIVKLVIHGPGEIKIYSGSRSPRLGWYSPRFEQREKISTICREACHKNLEWKTTISIPGTGAP